MSEQRDNPATFEMRAPFASLFEDGAQLLKLPRQSTLRIRPGEVRVLVRVRDDEFVVSHSDGPVLMQLGLLSGSNLVVSDGNRAIHIQFPGWKFKKVARAIRDAGVELDAVGILGRHRRIGPDDSR